MSIADAEGLDLKRCWAYSDSYNDIPLLSMVGHPVAINPDARLRSHAREHNWPVYDFRSGRRAATLGLKAATVGGVVYGLWRGFPLPRPHACRAAARPCALRDADTGSACHLRRPGERKCPPPERQRAFTLSKYLYFLLRRWWRVLRSSLRCFFLAIRLRRFLITEPTKVPHKLDAVPV